MLLISSTKKYIKDILSNFSYAPVFRRYSKYTMVPKKDFIDCLNLVSRFKAIQGYVIECGVWRGGMIGGMAEVCGEDREYYLFDSFEGLPAPKEIDGEGALKWADQKDAPNYYDNCKAEIAWAEKAMTISKAKNTYFMKGWFDETIPKFEPKEPIAVLRLDADWYESTMVCLEHLFPHVAVGGLVILDDYYTWDGCSKAVHDYLSKNKRPERIHKAYTSGCYLVKK